MLGIHTHVYFYVNFVVVRYQRGEALLGSNYLGALTLVIPVLRQAEGIFHSAPFKRGGGDLETRKITNLKISGSCEGIFVSVLEHIEFLVGGWVVFGYR